MCCGSLCRGSLCCGSLFRCSLCCGSLCCGSLCRGSLCRGSLCCGSPCCGSPCRGSPCRGSLCRGSLCCGYYVVGVCPKPFSDSKPRGGGERGENTLRRLALFVYLDMTPHPVKSELSGNIILFGHDKHNLSCSSSF